MAAARLPPMSGSEAVVVVLVVAEGLSVDGCVAQVISISKASQ